MAHLPKAVLVHRIKDRIRLKIRGISQDKADYFSRLQRDLNKAATLTSIETNLKTRSILIRGENVDLRKIAAYAADHKLFQLQENSPHSGNLVIDHSKKVVHRIDSAIRKISTNRLDVSSSLFVVLIIHAMREIAIGNLRTPSWFTALWFASTLYHRDFNQSPFEDGGSQDPGGCDR